MLFVGVKNIHDVRLWLLACFLSVSAADGFLTSTG